MLSLVCIYNNHKLLEDALLASLASQSFKDFEVILIDSKSENFLSASEALNFGGNKAKGEYLIFVHQDVVFTDNDLLYRINSYCEQYEFGIAGFAGISPERTFYSNVVHGPEKKNAGEGFVAVNNAISLDECILIVPSAVFKKYKFSYLGNTWHLYGTDYCLKMAQNNLDALIIPLKLWHLSAGVSLNLNYFDTIQKLCSIYKKNKVIYTVYGTWPTNSLCLFFKCEWRKFRLKYLGN